MNRKPLRIDILTIFPEMIEPYVTGSILGRAQKKKLVDIRAHDLRKWTNDRHHTVDDRPFGGGPGMVMKVEPFDRALKALRKEKRKKKNDPKKKIRIILTSAKGKIFTQADARRLSKYDRLVFLCGRYEGVDERVAEHLADEELSIGEYVMTGGELAALVMSDAVVRLRPGVLGKQESLAMESHSIKGTLEYPQYTRPEVYSPPYEGGVRGGSGRLTKKKKKPAWRVPKILLSGDHKKIEAWQRAFLIPRTF